MKKFLSFISIFSISLTLCFSQKLSAGSLESEETEMPDDFENLIVQNPDELFVSNQVPEIFSGIWEGDDRYIMFQDKDELEQILDGDLKLTENNYIWIYLKTFYGWYVDRSAEKNNRKNSKYPYDRNDTVFRDVQNIRMQFKPLVKSDNCCAYEIILTYPGIKESTVIPVCIIGDNLYLDFSIKTNELPESAVTQENPEKEKNPLTGSWSSVGKVNGIKVSKPIVSENLISTYITEDSVYHIRYWKTNMPYSSDMAFFSDGKHKYEVPKHIRSSGNIYTCVNGRSITIRNVERENLPLKDYVMNDEENVIAFGKPYMSRNSKTCSLSDMMKIVKVSNARKAPPQDPPFPPSNLDWHLEDITRLELGNEIIQAVRKRQREFYQKYKLGLHY